MEPVTFAFDASEETAALGSSPDAVAASARAAFGRARVAALPNGAAVVVASPREVVVDADALFARLPLAARIADPKGAATLAQGLLWREPPSTK